MTITAKYASTCATCKQSITPGTKIEWAKGQPVRHATCGQATAAPAYRSRRASTSARGTWNGCSCGARELPGGGLSSNACASCRFDEDDN